jgi:hypothetical protein
MVRTIFVFRIWAVGRLHAEHSTSLRGPSYPRVVKFGNGIPGRYSRMAGENGGECISVMLNPTLIDTLPSGASENTDAAMSAQSPEALMLQLRYLKNNVDYATRVLPEAGALPLADYLVIGGSS